VRLAGYASGMTDSGQLQPDETLVDRGVDDVLDEGMSPSEKLQGSVAKGTTVGEQREGETIDERRRQEEADVDLEPTGDDDEFNDPADSPPSTLRVQGGAPIAGDERSGRLVAPDEGVYEDVDPEAVAHDVGIDGGAASAEEAAVHEQPQ
jgi:hypothetical protein